MACFLQRNDQRRVAIAEIGFDDHFLLLKIGLDKIGQFHEFYRFVGMRRKTNQILGELNQMLTQRLFSLKNFHSSNGHWYTIQSIFPDSASMGHSTDL